MTQKMDALCLANDARRELRDIKRGLRTGTLDWRELILEPPACVAELLLCEVMLLIPFMGRGKVESLDRQAHAHGITLTVRAGRASTRTREWVADNALVYVAGSGRRARPHRVGVGGGRARREGVQGGGGMTTYYSPPRKCPLCGFVTADRAVYWAHRLTHEAETESTSKEERPS